MYLSQQDIELLPKVRRLNIINSITGVKPANLIGTKSKEGKPNVAIFSSIVHLGSNPALIGFFFRPQHENPKGTYLNIKATNVYTINQVGIDFVEQAHFTSARFPLEVSEFDKCKLTEEYLFDFYAPYVQESRLKIGLEMVDEIPIKANNTILVIGQVKHLFIPDKFLDLEGTVNLEKSGAAGISGVNSYYEMSLKSQFPYAHLQDVPDFE